MSDNKKLDLDSIAQAKAKLADDLRKLEEQEAQIRQNQASEAFSQVITLLNDYGSHFSAKQKAEITALIGESKVRKSATGQGKREVAPKYWLPHSGETWTGRGRTPKAFAAWEGTAAYNEWKSRHPEQKFPAYPG